MVQNAEQQAIRYERDADGIVTLTMDEPNSPVNLMNEGFGGAVERVVDRLYAEIDDVTGVIVASAKSTFFAGGDLEWLLGFRPEDSAANTAGVNAMKQAMRRLETLGKPVVAALGGSALGGGLEVALVTHHRIAVDSPRTRIGLPEVTLGLLPGGGGITRTVRMLGLQKALTEVIMPGTKFTVQDALEIGLIDEVVGTAEELDARARDWIKANPAPQQPWDVKGFKIPGGAPLSPSVSAVLPAMPAMLRARLGGAPMPAPRAALAAAVEGAYVDIDTALDVETRYFVHLANGQVSKNMIQAMFFDRAAAERAVAERAAEAPGESGAAATGAEPSDSAEIFTSRLVARRRDEAAAMLAEGIPASSISQAALQAGYGSSPLQSTGGGAGAGAEGATESATAAATGQALTAIPFEDLQERLLFAEAIEAIGALDEGVVASVPEANVASIFTAGFPVWAGGALQFVNQYEGGLAGFVARARELEASYGPRFAPPASLVARAERGERYR